MDYELRAQISRIARVALAAGMPAAVGLPAGVKALDLWSNGRYGSVLFWVDRELDISDFGHAVLIHDNAKRFPDGKWRSTGGGAMGSYEPQRILADLPPGLHKLGAGSQDPMRVTVAIASPDVDEIRLRDANSTHERPPGVDGFCLLGITHQDPITYAYALNSEGEKLPSEPLLL